MSNFSFNGKRKPYCDYMDYKSGWGESRELEITDVRGRPGGVLSNIKRGVREIECEILVDAYENTQDLEALADDFIAWLTTDEPKELIFDREPDKVYYAMLSSQIDRNYFVTFAKATVKFTCLDPYKYSVKTFSNTAISDQVSVGNVGTAATPPIIEARALKAANYFEITKGDEDYFKIGDDNVDKVYKDYSPSIYSSEITTMVDWTKQTTTNFTDNYTGGTVGGIFKQSPTKDSVLLDTTSSSGTSWNGAMYKRSFTKSAQDFKSTVRFIIGQKNKGAVRAAQYIYDTDNRVIASLGYVNPSPSQNIGRIIVTLFNQNGDQTKIYEYANKPSIYSMNDFVVYVELQRVGNLFTITTWKYTDQKRKVIFDQNKVIYTDKGNFYMRPVASLSLFSAKYADAKTFPLFIAGTFNNELLPKPPNANDMFIQPGDEITIDMENKSVIINEKSALDQKDFGSDYFEIEKGISELTVWPQGVFDTKVLWRDRYL